MTYVKPPDRSPTLKLAEELRGDASSPSRLYTSAQAEAEELIERLRTIVRISGQRPTGVAALLKCHLTARSLGEDIYTHALVHAHLVVRTDTGKPFRLCPRCGGNLEDAANSGKPVASSGDPAL